MLKSLRKFRKILNLMIKSINTQCLQRVTLPVISRVKLGELKINTLFANNYKIWMTKLLRIKASSKRRKLKTAVITN